MTRYEDKRGWQYQVRPGLGEDQYKGFYRKPGKAGWHAVHVLKWCDTAYAAEGALFVYAMNHSMKIVIDNEGGKDDE